MPRIVDRAIPLFLGLLSVAVACTPATPAATGPGPSTRPAVDQKLTWGTSGLASTLHPYISITGSQRRYDIYDTIIHQKDDLTLGPAVATSWRTVDPTTWEFKLRTDMKFHDGTPLTATDVKFSIDRANEPEKKYAIAGRLLTLDKTTIVDPTTIRVTTKGPDPIFPKRIMMVSVLPKAYLEQVGDEGFQAKPIGSGPFRVADWRESSHLRIVAMPEHPYRKATLTEVTIKQIPEASGRVAGLRSGELDYIDALPIDQAKTLETAGFKIIVQDFGASAGFSMDTVINDDPTPYPTRDKRVRQALNYAVDKDAIVKNIYQGYTKVEQCQIIQPQTFGFNPKLKAYPKDNAKAKQLLAEAGYPNGFKITLRGQRNTAEAEPVALFVQSQLREVGVEVEYQPIGDIAIYRDLFYGVQARPGMFVIGLTNRPAYDADFALTWFAGSVQKGGTRHYDNPAFNAAYEASTTEMNEQKRLEHFHRATEVFCDDAPYLFLIQVALLQAGRSDIQGQLLRPDQPDLSVLKRS